MSDARRRARVRWPEGSIELIPGQEVTIGRSAGNDICLPGEREASRRHAKVVWPRGDGDLLLIDCDSTNGTWVGGKRIASHFLSDGARFQIGGCVFVVALPERRGERDPRDVHDPQVVISGLWAQRDRVPIRDERVKIPRSALRERAA